MNVDIKRLVRTLLTAGAVTLVATTGVSAAATMNSAGHAGAHHAQVAHATKEWKLGTGSTGSTDVSVATKEWKTGTPVLAPSTKEW